MQTCFRYLDSWPLLAFGWTGLCYFLALNFLTSSTWVVCASNIKVSKRIIRSFVYFPLFFLGTLFWVDKKTFAESVRNIIFSFLLILPISLSHCTIGMLMMPYMHGMDMTMMDINYELNFHEVAEEALEVVQKAKLRFSHWQTTTHLEVGYLSP